MNQDILLAKIVPNTTDTTWSQAYTTLNVYMTLSIENETSKIPVVSFGKELLEKLQREFFALDDKSLEHIKKAVSNVIKTIEPEYKYSIIVGAIVKNILYIVTASEGKVIIKRGGAAGSIAQGEEGELIGFSGELKHDDIVIFETGDFAKKIPLPTLQEYLSSSDVSQIAENITPLIHDNSKGTEASIILQFKDFSKEIHSDDSPFQIDEETAEKEEKIENKEEVEGEIDYKKNLWTEAPNHENRNIEELDEKVKEEDERVYKEEEKGRSFNFPQFNFLSKKLLIGLAIVLLVSLLVGGIFYQRFQEASKKNLAEFEKVLKPAQSKLEEGEALASLNKSQAVAALNEALAITNDATAKFSPNSNEYKKLEELKLNIENKLKEIGGGSSAQNVKEILKAGADLASIDGVTLKGGSLVIASSKDKSVGAISNEKLGKLLDTKDEVSYVSADEKFIFTLGNSGVTKIDKGNGKAETAVEDTKGIAIDIFGGNIYVLNGNDVTKYRGPTYTGSSYFSETPGFKNTPIDMSISGPVYILETNGAIERFTKGKKEEFEVKGLIAPFSETARIYTDGDFENVYVMDVKNQRVVVINNKGEYQNQYEGNFIKDAVSFAIDEKNKTGYVVSNNTLFSFDL